MRCFIFAALLLCGLVTSVAAQTVVAAHPIRARSIISCGDISILDVNTVGAITNVDEIIGKEARVNLYAGRAIRPSEIGSPAVIERNELVVMVYRVGLLSISAEGRVLDRGAVGELVRVMNLESRMTITGRVLLDGTIEVGS